MTSDGYLLRQAHPSRRASATREYALEKGSARLWGQAATRHCAACLVVTYGCSWERNLLAVPSDGIILAPYFACFNNPTAQSSPFKVAK